MIKICHLTSAHNSKDVRILEKECVSLAKISSNKVYLVARGDSFFYKNVEIVGIGKVAGSRLIRIFRTSKQIYREAMSINADIYHLHDPELLLYVRKLKKQGKKVIFDSHESYADQILLKNYIPKCCRKIVAKIYQHIENKACRYLDGAIFPCKMGNEHPFYKRVENCAFINNVPLVEEFDELAKISNTEKIGNAVCCVGSLDADRGIEVLIDACYRVNIKLILAGNFSSGEFKKYIENKKEYAIVDYKGFCSRKEVIDIYKEATIGASTILNVGQYSKANNLPTKVYEYMMAQIPCILSNNEYNKKIVEQYGFGIIVDVDNVDEIVKAIEYLCLNETEGMRMGKRGRQLIIEKFNWDIEEEYLYDFYKKVMGIETHHSLNNDI